MKKMMPIGIEDFAKLRTNNYYYVDKTGLIKKFLGNRGEVNLFTRPRRFGKSLNMSMLKYFFEIGTDKSLFDGLAISKETELCEKYMGQYPVVFITLKGIEGSDFNTARSMAVAVINEEARKLSFLLDSDKLSKQDKQSFALLFDREMEDVTLFSSLRLISKLLQRHHGKKVIILIDEYDAPLAKANQLGYYNEMVKVISYFFNVSLKANQYLEFAILTGCLRVSYSGSSTKSSALSLGKECVFPGLDTSKPYTLLEAECDEQFGFTDEEVREMLTFYDLNEYYDITKEWYYGYKIGRANVYNPWDVINWCDQLLTDANKVPRNYWVNSSGNDEVQNFVEKMGNGVAKTQIERLISGETVRKQIKEQIAYDTMYDSVENMWSLLYAAGYLTQSETPSGNLVWLTISNMEIRSMFRDSVLKVFEKKIAQDGGTVSDFCEALKSGETAKVERVFTDLMKYTIGIRDTAIKKKFKESFYHRLLLVILGFKYDWGVEPIRDPYTRIFTEDSGAYDIVIEIEDESIGIIIEVKYAENEKFDATCKEAMNQIQEHDYTSMLRKDDMQTILKYGIACYKKTCKVVLEREG